MKDLTMLMSAEKTLLRISQPIDAMRSSEDLGFPRQLAQPIGMKTIELENMPAAKAHAAMIRLPIDGARRDTRAIQDRRARAAGARRMAAFLDLYLRVGIALDLLAFSSNATRL